MNTVQKCFIYKSVIILLFKTGKQEQPQWAPPPSGPAPPYSATNQPGWAPQVQQGGPYIPGQTQQSGPYIPGQAQQSPYGGGSTVLITQQVFELRQNFLFKDKKKYYI